jgi:hypothetical protein
MNSHEIAHYEIRMWALAIVVVIVVVAVVTVRRITTTSSIKESRLISL